MNLFEIPNSFAMFTPEGNAAVKQIVRDALVRTQFKHRYVTGVRTQSPFDAYLSASQDLSKLTAVHPEATDTAVMECVYSAIVEDGKGIIWR